MALSSGTCLGPYEILSIVGAGGMGEVYRARDRKLDRDVAIKVLPPAVAADPERIARFEREAQLLATLNHPNIAHIYGLEESAGIRALVIELVDGPTLADRIATGRIPVEEALPLARQITEALEAAHEQGIVHRDLKPANIKLRPDGTVKVLDFGLAKVLEPTAASSAIVTQSPTITSPAMMTGVGVILGTAACMSPEQAVGKRLDRRTDIWSFGVILWEMLTGRRLFNGETVTHTLADVLKVPIDFTACLRTRRQRFEFCSNGVWTATPGAACRTSARRGSQFNAPQPSVTCPPCRRRSSTSTPRLDADCPRHVGLCRPGSHRLPSRDRRNACAGALLASRSRKYEVHAFQSRRFTRREARRVRSDR